METYSPKQVRLVIGGYQLVGWDSISISRSVKGFTTIKGIRGKNTRVRNTDTSATLTIPLIQTSPSNDVLSYIHELDLDEGTGRLSLTLKDSSGRSIFSSNEGYIVSYPQASFSGELTYRSWDIFCQTTGSYTIGGNTRPETNLLDSAINSASNYITNLV